MSLSSGKVKLIYLRRPEGGAEVHSVYSTHHRCPQGNALQRTLGPQADLLVFPVGSFGASMPLDEPFLCVAEPCPACGRELTAGFVWTKGHRATFGELQLPGDHGDELSV